MLALVAAVAYSLLVIVPVNSRVLSDSTEFVDEVVDDYYPSRYLSMVHNPSEQEVLIHQISKKVLQATKDLLSLSPRSSRDYNASVSERLARMQQLHTSQADEMMKARNVLVPPLQPPSACSYSLHYRTMDGSCNNLQNPCWGKADEAYQRWLQPVYANGVDSPRVRADHRPLPSPRQVYQWVSSQQQQTINSTLPHLTSFVTLWGQMVAHEMILTPVSTVTSADGKENIEEFITGKVFQSTPELSNGSRQATTYGGGCSTGAIKCCKENFNHNDCMPVRMNYEDGFYKTGHCMDIARSSAYVYNPKSCTPLTIGSQRQQMNQLTAFLDASLVYGTSDEEMLKLREHNGKGAKLMVDSWRCPLRKNRECRTSHRVCDKRCFHAGEKRANENPVLASLHVVWVREHNRIVDLLSRKGWSEDTLFHVARKIVGAIMQHITYSEYLPAILGPNLVQYMNLLPTSPNYHYDERVNPTIYNVFATAAFRYGHSMIDSRLLRKNMGYSASPLLSHDFFSMDEFCEPVGDPLDSLLEGQAEQRPQSVDCLFSKQITQHLFAGRTNGLGLDLFSINIQRGRDHGLPPYTKWREACSITPHVRDYADLRGDIPDHVLERIQAIYGPGGVHEVDLYVGGISEVPVNGGILGRTFTCIVANQFSALKFGDRFWYENIRHPGAFTPGQIHQIQKTNLAGLLCRNSNMQQIQKHAFFAESPHNPKVPCDLLKFQTILDSNYW